eukprot:9298601-Lingulodinium_polyedra.AAC.1
MARGSQGRRPRTRPRSEEGVPRHQRPDAPLDTGPRHGRRCPSGRGPERQRPSSPQAMSGQAPEREAARHEPGRVH